MGGFKEKYKKLPYDTWGDEDGGLQKINSFVMRQILGLRLLKMRDNFGTSLSVIISGSKGYKMIRRRRNRKIALENVNCAAGAARPWRSLLTYALKLISMKLQNKVIRMHA